MLGLHDVQYLYEFLFWLIIFFILKKVWHKPIVRAYYGYSVSAFNVIAVFFLLLIDMTDTWTRKAIKWMDKADKWIRKLIDDLFEWIHKKNLKIISSIILLIILGILAQLGIIPKLIT